MIYTIGESLLDIIFKDNVPVAAKAGGSMLNTSVSLARLGSNVEFISEAGSDYSGRLIKDFLNSNNVGTRFFRQNPKIKTPLALAFLDEQNNARYDFYKPQFPAPVEWKLPSFKKNDILIFGSYFAIEDRSRGYLRQVLTKAKKANAIVLYDPNIRSHRLNQKMVRRVMTNIGKATIFRASEEDCLAIWQTDELEEIWKKVYRSGCRVFVYTRAEKKVNIRTPFFVLNVNVPQIKPVSTVGAGDSFNAGLAFALTQIKAKLPDFLAVQMLWYEYVRVAIEAAIDVCMSYDNYVSHEVAREIRKSFGLEQ